MSAPPGMVCRNPNTGIPAGKETGGDKKGDGFIFKICWSDEFYPFGESSVTVRRAAG
jgi:hypothetical protein